MICGPWCTRLTTGLFRPLRLAGSAPPPSKEPREGSELVSLPVPLGEMSRNETEGAIEQGPGTDVTYPLTPSTRSSGPGRRASKKPSANQCLRREDHRAVQDRMHPERVTISHRTARRALRPRGSHVYEGPLVQQPSPHAPARTHTPTRVRGPLPCQAT